jgi:hypothetical protein
MKRLHTYHRTWMWRSNEDTHRAFRGKHTCCTWMVDRAALWAVPCFTCHLLDGDRRGCARARFRGACTPAHARRSAVDRVRARRLSGAAPHTHTCLDGVDQSRSSGRVPWPYARMASTRLRSQGRSVAYAPHTHTRTDEVGRCSCWARSVTPTHLHHARMASMGPALWARSGGSAPPGWRRQGLRSGRVPWRTHARTDGDRPVRSPDAFRVPPGWRRWGCVRRSVALHYTAHG